MRGSSLRGCSGLPRGKLSGDNFLVILEPSNCFSSATLSASYEADLGGPVAVESNFWTFEFKVCQRSSVGLTLPSLRLNW